MEAGTKRLVVLTWLRQHQEYFYKIGDATENGDWNTHGKCVPIKARHVTREYPLDNMHMMKANSTAVAKTTSVQWIKPDSKNTKKVVKSLEEWQQKYCVGTTIMCKTQQMQMKIQKHASKGLKIIRQINMQCQIHPTNQTIRRQVTTLILSSSHQNNNNTKLQTNYICIFVIS